MKKKLFLTFACLAFFVGAGFAQDIITKQDGGTVRAKVSEVNTESVRYKKFELPDGPDYVLVASEVFMIKYENGNRDIFEKDPATGQIKIRHIQAETQPASKPASSAPESKPATSTPAAKPAAATTASKPAASTPTAKPATSTPAATPAAVFPSGVRINQASNGTFTLLGFEGASLKFSAAVATHIYMVSLTSDGRTVKAGGISNTRGNIVFDGGATARAGSSLLLGRSDMNLQKDTEAQCTFEGAPAGFTAKTIVFLTGEKAAPMTFDLASGEWINDGTNIAEEPPAQPQPADENKTAVETADKTANAIRFPGGSCTIDNLDLNPRFAPAGMSFEKEKSFILVLKYTLEAGTELKALDVLSGSGMFVAPDGTVYKAGASIRNDKFYRLIVAVPKHVDVATLKYIFDGQTLPLGNTQDGAPAANGGSNSAAVKSNKETVEIKVTNGNTEKTYRLSFGEIGHNDKGNTTVKIIRHNGDNILSFVNGQVFIPIHAKMLADGKTVEYKSVSVSAESFVYEFETAATPTRVTVYGNGDKNSPSATFDVATKKIVK